MQDILLTLHRECIEGTEEKTLVAEKRVCLCFVTWVVHKNILEPEGCTSRKVHITTKSLKHLYDKKPAQEYDFVIHHVHLCARYPDKIYRNRDNKTGHLCFTKRIKNTLIFCSMELVQRDNHTGCEIVTAFVIRKDEYLRNYELLWEWKGDIPSS